MKSIYDMSKEEVLGLSPESIANLIDYECATRGIRLLPSLPVAPELSKIEPDLNVYEVCGFAFTSPGDALAVLDILGSSELYRTVNPGSGDYSTKILKTVDTGDYYYPEIESVKVFSPELWEKVKAEKTANTERKRVYDAAKAEYDDAIKDRQAIIDDVTELIAVIRAEKRKYDFYVSEFYRYLELAEGNAVIAANFLTAAYRSLIEEFPELLEELKGMVEFEHVESEINTEGCDCSCGCTHDE